MKSILLIFSLAVLTLAAGAVYADDLPYMATKDTGTEIYESAFGVQGGNVGVLCAKDFGTAGIPSATIDAKEISTFAYNDAVMEQEHLMALRSARGSAAGGVCPEEKIVEGPTAKIWDNLMGAPGGSDLP